MIGHPLDGYPLPVDALQILHRADFHVLHVHDRPLLNVKLHKCLRLQKARLDRPLVTGPLQLFTQNRAVRPHRGDCLIHCHTSCVDQGTHHIRGIAHALFVGESADDNRSCAPYASIPQGFDHLNPADHTQAAVVLPGIDHRVDVRADHQGLLQSVFLRLPDAEHISDPVHHQLKARLPDPARHQVPAFLLRVRGCKTGSPALRILSNFSQSMDSLHQSCTID